MSDGALTRLLDNAVEYESWRVPFDDGMRRSTVISGISLITAMFNLLLAPVLLNWTYSGYFLFGAQFFRGILSALHDGQIGFLIIFATSLIVYGFLLYKTDQLAAGATKWHHVATGEVILGSLSGFILAVEIVVVLLNLFLWGVYIVIGIGIALALLAALCGAAAR